MTDWAGLTDPPRRSAEGPRDSDGDHALPERDGVDPCRAPPRPRCAPFQAPPAARARTRLRTSAKNRVFGLLTQWGLRIRLERLRQPDGLELLEADGVPEVWRRSVVEALAVIELLDERIAPLDRELGSLARADRRAT